MQIPIELMSTEEIFIRLLIAMFLGALIGAERTFAGKSAGVRTFALVALSAALFVILGQVANHQYLGKVSFDPARTIAAIISGIGFLGAGIIFMHKNKRKGLTTAAGFWITAAIGASAGLGLLKVSMFATFLVLFVFTFLWFVEQRFKAFASRYQRTVVEKKHPETIEID